MALSRAARRAIAKQRQKSKLERMAKRAIAERNMTVQAIVQRNLSGPKPCHRGNIRSSMTDLETAAPAGKPRNWHKQSDGTVGTRGLKERPLNDRAIESYRKKISALKDK